MPDKPESLVTAEDEHARNARVRRSLLRLSLANWGVAALAWTVSAYLGITSPAHIIVYTVLFVIGLFAVAVALATYLLEKFAHRPAPVLSPAGADDDRDGESRDAAAPSA